MFFYPFPIKSNKEREKFLFYKFFFLFSHLNSDKFLKMQRQMLIFFGVFKDFQSVHMLQFFMFHLLETETELMALMQYKYTQILTTLCFNLNFIFHFFGDFFRCLFCFSDARYFTFVQGDSYSLIGATVKFFYLQFYFF